MATTTKKATDKKPAAKKPAAKPAAKKPAAKKPAVKKPATKVAAKKPAVKKPAVKTTKAAAKPATKAAPKTAARKPAVKSASAPVAERPKEEAEEKFRNLFDAFIQGKLPLDQGYIISAFFNDANAYSIYEIVSYSGVKEIFPIETGLQFVTGGKKLYILLEPDIYNLKYQEPVSRKEDERIPKRFSELEIITAKNQSKIMVAKEPNETYGSFTILKPLGNNISVVFYQNDDIYETIESWFEKSLNEMRKVPRPDAKRAAQLISATVEKYMSFKSEYD